MIREQALLYDDLIKEADFGALNAEDVIFENDKIDLGQYMILDSTCFSSP